MMVKKERPIIAVSACLLGQLVRHNGNHCEEAWLVEELSKFVDFYPLCPEVEMKLGVPREEIHLVYENGDKNNISLRTKTTKENLTSLALQTYQEMNAKLSLQSIDGFILTKKSPSCGLDNVKTVNIDDPQSSVPRTGLFAKFVCDLYPLVPKIDSGRIRNLELREHFIKNVFAHFRFKNLDQSTSGLQEFHKKYKYVIMDHSSDDLKKLGSIASNSKKLSNAEIYEQYYIHFFSTLKKLATVKKRMNTLMHILGYFKKDLSKDEKQEILIMFNEFRDGILNHMTPQRFFEFLTKKHQEKYLTEQYFFSPYPKEMKISKHI
jgi:uncharacterized protein YbgA (DUF1722 family)/uncharacterized protein YbbK (DUF523 family)